MLQPARKRATYADVLAAPEGWTAEIIDGELHLSPRPSSPHLGAASILGADLIDAFGRLRGGRGPGGWWILDEPELHLGEDDPRDEVLVPDLGGWRRARMPRVPDTPGFTLPPDWVCEVVSPGSVRRDRVLKLRVYSRVQVAHVWLVDPLARTLEVLRLEGDHYAIVAAHAGDEMVRAEPFDMVDLDIGGWWLTREEEPA